MKNHICDFILRSQKIEPKQPNDQLKVKFQDIEPWENYEIKEIQNYELKANFS